jgi:hypothetical protein
VPAATANPDTARGSGCRRERNDRDRNGRNNSFSDHEGLQFKNAPSPNAVSKDNNTDAHDVSHRRLLRS